MAPTSADYLWFEEAFPDLAEAYCITLVKGLTPEELLERLQGEALPPLTGTAAMVDAAYEFTKGRQLVALLRIGGWTLMIEPNGYIGVTEDAALSASAGTTWISHFENINGLDTFLWAENSTILLTFEPIFPDGRWGTPPGRPIGGHAPHRLPLHGLRHRCRAARKRVRRLARAAGPACVHPRPYKATTVQGPANRRGLVDLALDMAIRSRRPRQGEVVMHTDRGSQYTGSRFRDHCPVQRGHSFGGKDRDLLRQRHSRVFQRNSEEGAYSPACMGNHQAGENRNI